MTELTYAQAGAAAPDHVTTVTADEAFDSLTGFDEIAITKAFGRPITAMADNRADAFTFLRALIFIFERRDGMKDTEAYAASMSLTTGAVSAYFTPGDDGDGDEADEGKDS